MQVAIDTSASAAPGEQLRSQLSQLIIGGSLAEGTRLPSVRQLASDLRLAAGTVARVYRDLEASEYVTTGASGTWVAERGNEADRERRRVVEEAARAFVDTTQRVGADLADALDAVRTAFSGGDGVGA